MDFLLCHGSKDKSEGGTGNLAVTIDHFVILSLKWQMEKFLPLKSYVPSFYGYETMRLLHVFLLKIRQRNFELLDGRWLHCIHKSAHNSVKEQRTKLYGRERVAIYMAYCLLFRRLVNKALAKAINFF